MCGIFGYIGSGDGVAICLDGLKKIEYRGYDSAGLVAVDSKKDELCFWKEVGKVERLERLCRQGDSLLSPVVAHTRWATHGVPSWKNAHPQFDQRKQVAVVHNGIIENYLMLRKQLEERGVSFYSETDTEVIAHWIAHFYEGDLAAAVEKTLALLQGFWALAIIHIDHPDRIIAVARNSSLAVGLKANFREAYLSSDPNAFPQSDLDILFLHDDELALIFADRVEVFDAFSTLVKKVPERLQLENSLLSKEPFEHFMLKEICEQPESLRQSYHNRLIEDSGLVEFENFALTPHYLQSIEQVLILACGSSWHAGLIAASFFEEYVHIPARAEIASEFRYRNPLIPKNTLVIAISQSGETLDTIAAVKEAKQKGCLVVAICNVRHSRLTREADATIFLRAGPEISVCSTKGFTNQLSLLSLFAIFLGRQRHLGKEEGQELLLQLRQMPLLLKGLIDNRSIFENIAKRYSHYRNFFFLGRHYMFPTCLEAALKLKEISYLHAAGYPAGELKHGPIALVEPNLVVVGLCGNRRTQDKIVSNLMEVKSRGAPVIAFAFEKSGSLKEVADELITIPHCCDELAPIPFSVAAQLFAYYIAKELGTNIDQPRNLAKSVTVE